MNILLVFALSLAFFYLGAKIYGRTVARWLGEDLTKQTPAEEINDGVDYVPTNLNVLFGHHFSSIAGAGPIVGPTVAILFGYLPVWMWIIIGCIFIGAVHDFAALFVSLRERGRSIAEITNTALGKTGFFLFVSFTILLLVLVTSSFLSMTVQTLTSTAPLSLLGLGDEQTLLRTVIKDGVTHGVIGGVASTSVIIITLFAPVLGVMLYKKHIKTAVVYISAAVVAVGSLYIGLKIPVSINPKMWMLILSAYVTLAAGLPVWLILQPRDFTNVQIMYLGMILIFIVVVVGGIQGINLQAPAIALDEGAVKLGGMWPFLFITVACGAVSGFHSLVASGTSSKQLAKEGQARKVGYNAMILEGVLAICAVLIVGAALSQADYLRIVWPQTGSSNPILAFALSMGIMLERVLGIPVYIGSLGGILMVEGFVVTTLDASVRLNRYLFEELWNVLFKGNTPKIMKASWFNAGLAVGLMLWLGWNNAFTMLWPLFATCNQLLAALGLLAVSAWLLKRKRQAWFTIIPAIFMVVTTIASLIMLLTKFIKQITAPGVTSISGPLTLMVMDVLCLGLAVGVVVMTFKTFKNIKNETSRIDTVN